jgi:hypothetical protein
MLGVPWSTPRFHGTDSSSVSCGGLTLLVNGSGPRGLTCWRLHPSTERLHNWALYLAQLRARRRKKRRGYLDSYGHSARDGEDDLIHDSEAT